MNKKLISYIFPIYNEEETLLKLYEEITKFIENHSDEYNFEIICVNDGSTDRSTDLLIDMHNKDNRFKILNFSRNFGQQMAITAGLEFCKGEAAIIMDADLQDPLNVCIELLEKWQQGFEVVYAQRQSRKDSIFKRITAAIFYRLLYRIADIKIPKDAGEFKLMDRRAVEAFKLFKETNRFNRGITSYIGFRQTAVLFDRDKRFAGETKYSISKLINLAFDAITAFSTFPLKLITRIGFLMLVTSIISFIITLFIKLFVFESGISDAVFVIISIFIASSIQLIVMGILGAYTGRIYTEVQNRPLYIISSVLN